MTFLADYPEVINFRKNSRAVDYFKKGPLKLLTQMKTHTTWRCNNFNCCAEQAEKAHVKYIHHLPTYVKAWEKHTGTKLPSLRAWEAGRKFDLEAILRHTFQSWLFIDSGGQCETCCTSRLGKREIVEWPNYMCLDFGRSCTVPISDVPNVIKLQERTWVMRGSINIDQACNHFTDVIRCQHGYFLHYDGANSESEFIRFKPSHAKEAMRGSGMSLLLYEIAPSADHHYREVNFAIESIFPVRDARQDEIEQLFAARKSKRQYYSSSEDEDCSSSEEISVANETSELDVPPPADDDAHDTANLVNDCEDSVASEGCIGTGNYIEESGDTRNANVFCEGRGNHIPPHLKAKVVLMSAIVVRVAA
jgi:hypothetical protein